MKLISVEIYGKDFRSLTANRRYAFHVSEHTKRLSTKCFAGLNGSGKSNMLELISEIFYFLEYWHLQHGDPIKKKGKEFGFEIEYAIPMNEYDRNYVFEGPVKEKWMHVRISKPLDEERELEFSVKPWDNAKYDYVTVDEGTELLLPKKVMAYTSGQNEMLSNPFYKLKYHYFRELTKSEKEEISDRMFYIDASNNFSIFISNMLLGEPRKRAHLEKAFKMEGLQSFRITVNLHDPSNKKIEFSPRIQAIIQKLKACASAWDEQPYYGSKIRHQLILDFFVSSATREAFGFHFEDSAMNLFKDLYQLDMLNVGLQKEKVHKLVHNAKKDLNISDELPHIHADDLVFRIERILIRKKDQKAGEKPMKYKNLSDGEHQFNEVIGSMMLMEEEGCLLLYDEPDTHFNPLWRSKIMSLFNQMAANGYNSEGEVTSIREQEVIITTHSPFAISDSFREDVYLFEKTDSGVVINNPKIPTYGASVSVILENVFNNDSTIASMSNHELEEIKKLADSEDTIEEAREKLHGFGESIERFNAIRYIRARENEFNQE